MDIETRRQQNGQCIKTFFSLRSRPLLSLILVTEQHFSSLSAGEDDADYSHSPFPPSIPLAVHRERSTFVLDISMVLWMSISLAQ